jgi:hypothetical protein
MPKLKKFSQFVNEAEVMTIPLKGYDTDVVIQRIEELVEALSDGVKFGVPSDYLGRATTYKDANGAIQRIKDIQHYYDSKAEEVRFYCWSISYEGSWKATKNLRNKIEKAGGFGDQPNNINLKKVIDYFTENAEDSDNVATISISIDSPTVRKSMQVTKPAETQPQQPTDTRPQQPAEEQEA